MGFKNISPKLSLSFILSISVFAGIFFVSEFEKTETEIQVLPDSTIEKKQATLMFVGDIILDRGVEYYIVKEGNGDFSFPFLKIADYLKEADILVGNLETPVSDKGEKAGSIYSFRSDPKAIEGLVFAGFDILSVANNHAFDYGRPAFEDTLSRLKVAGISYIGGGFSEAEAHTPVIKEVNGTKIAFLEYTNLGSPHWEAKGVDSGISWLDKGRMEEDVKKAKEMADIVVVAFHYGEEYALEPNQFQKDISQAAIDAGADLVIGHHPHVVQPTERYKNGFIAYSLGNFVFDQGFSDETQKGLLIRVLVENGKIKEIIPVDIRINQYFQPEAIKI